MKHIGLAALILTAMALIEPARAEDQIIDVKTCHFFCGLWRNVSRNAQVAFVRPVDNAGRIDPRPPNATEGASLPSATSLVARPGSVMVESAAERAASKRQRAAMERALKSGTSTVGKAAASP